MDLLETIKKTRGSEAALGLTLGCCRDHADLPEGSKLIGYTNSLYFCNIAGYLGTVFAVDPDAENYAVPIAYDFTDFVRLILSCGSAQAAASAAFYSQDGFQMVLRSENTFSHTDLARLGNKLDLKSMPDPYQYVQTVRSVIDCGRIGRKQEREEGHGKKIDQGK